MADDWETNRTRKRKARSGRFWCWCDMALVGYYERCPRCRKRNGRKRDKK